MLRRILAGLVVVAFIVSCSFTLVIGSMNPLTYQPTPMKGHQAIQLKAQQQVVQLFLENTQGLAGASVPLSFGKPGSDIVCTEVNFEGSRVEHFLHWVQKDNENKKVLIGVIRALDEQIQDQLPPGQGLFATLTFETKTGCEPQLSVINWDLAGGGKLYFHMVDAPGNVFYREKIEEKQAARSIPLKSGSGGEPTLSRPTEFNLQQNYPNPFNPETIINFSLSEDSWVTLKVFNLLGQVVTTLVDEQKSAGEYAIRWDGKNSQNQDVASGVYFYRIKAGDYESVRRMTLLR